MNREINIISKQHY